MKSWQSKVSLLLALTATSAGLSSCKLFGGGEYSSQLEVETEVPESLEHGKASNGPTEKTSNYASTATSVPTDSNLIDLPELPSDTAPLPTVATSHTGGASMTGMPAGGYDHIEIPKPDFAAVNLNSTTRRAPAEMISLGPPTATPRMALDTDPAAHTYTSKVTEEKLEPIPPPVPSEAELASAPAATKDAPPEAAPVTPGVPLLHSGARLADYYQNLHNSVLNKTVVENTAPPAPGEAAPAPVTPPDEPLPPPASADDLSVPPPPPAE